MARHYRYCWNLLVICLLFYINGSRSALPCSNTMECEEKLRRSGSECLDGFCSNPFHRGCLVTMGVPEARIRTCNSDDDDDAATTATSCEWNTEFIYPQVRIHNGNWESSIFYAWILQILLMEVLRVPATVGLTTETTSISSFYSINNTLHYSSKAYPFEALRNAKDCLRPTTTTTTTAASSSSSEECTQVLPEVWNGQKNEWIKALSEGYIEPTEGNGQVGKGSWYIPKFTAESDSSLVSVYGLSGEENRQKLAEAFLRPTSWIEYCQEVSPTNCSEPDGTASTYPPSEADEIKYYSPGFYTGHFRMTEENDCTIHPETCLGHIVGPDCTWSTDIDAQLYWNDIKLQPDGPLHPNGGYDYPSMLEIWRAANATKSNVMMWWWRPEALVEEFHGSDAQFQQVLLPEATDTCSNARVGTEARCSEDIMERRGNPEASCDQEAHALQRVVSKAFAQDTLNQSIQDRSPSYELIKSIAITDLAINTMLRRWSAMGIDPFGNDAREVVCTWVVENYDSLLDYIPAGYPKQLVRNRTYHEGYFYGAMAMGALCTVVVLVVAVLSYRWRQTKVFVYAQAHIIYLILAGFFLFSVGAIFMALEPSSFVCISQAWLVNLGYTVALVPLLVKISAINKIVSAASKMKRVKISRISMFKQVGLIVFCAVVFLVIWTIIDPLEPSEVRHMPDPEGDIVEASMTCSSESAFWEIATFSWRGLLLLTATVLAFQSRDIDQAFNESRRLGTMIYSHMIFLLLHGAVQLLNEREILQPTVVSCVLSFLLSFDAFFAIMIYFVPKLMEAHAFPEKYLSTRGTSRTSVAVDAITRNAEREQELYQTKASMVDATGTIINTSQVATTSSEFYQHSQDGGNGFATHPEKSILRNRLRKNMPGISEGSNDTSDVGSHLKAPTRLATNSHNDAVSSRDPSCPSDELRDTYEDEKRQSMELGEIASDLSPELWGSAIEPEKSLSYCLDSDDQSDHDDGASDEEDCPELSGGPRYNNHKANQDLERSIRLNTNVQDLRSHSSMKK